MLSREGAGGVKEGGLNLLSKRQIFKRRQKMWRGGKGEIETLPAWMEWKPESINEEGARLDGNIGALLLTGAQLHLVSQMGLLGDPDLVGEGGEQTGGDGWSEATAKATYISIFA